MLCRPQGYQVVSTFPTLMGRGTYALTWFRKGQASPASAARHRYTLFQISFSEFGRDTFFEGSYLIPETSWQSRILKTFCLERCLLQFTGM